MKVMTLLQGEHAEKIGDTRVVDDDATAASAL